MMARFGLDELNQIVELAGRELEREDRYIAGCFDRNAAYRFHGPQWSPGIYYLDDEKYYQRTVARALLASFPLRVSLEETVGSGTNEHFDLVLYPSDSDERLAV
ncbi:MAG TPA: hypothetical protein VL523_18635, partial [Terriglobia bacterium]|nr:hypothetical protein [Terriglobia bacterium]